MNKPSFTATGRAQAVKTLLSLARSLCLVLSFVALVPTSSFAKDDYTIEHEDGLFTLSAHDASLSSVVNKLSEMTEIPMNIAEGQDTTITLSFSDYTLESLIAELTSSSMIVRRNIDGDDVISEVVFMLGSEGNDTAAAALPSGEPNAGIIAGDNVDNTGENAGNAAAASNQGSAEASTSSQQSDIPKTEIQAPAVDPQTGQPVQATQ